MRRLIVHLGVQKTGTTSLQNFLARNRAALAGRMAVLTPTKDSPLRGVGRAATAFSLAPSAASEAALAQALADCMLDIAATGTTLLSHENLPGAVIGNGGTVQLYPKIAQILALVDAAFKPLVPEYVIYTRDMPAWKRSVHGQVIRTDGYTRTLPDFLAETEDCGDWADLAARMTAAVGPRVTVFRLEDEPHAQFPGTQLLRHAGLTDADIAALNPIPGRQNRAMNAGALEFARLVNTIDVPPRVRRMVIDLAATHQSLFNAGPVTADAG